MQKLVFRLSVSVSQSVCQSVSLSVSQSVFLSVCQSVSLSVFQCVSLSVCQSVCLSGSQSVSQSVCLSVCQSVCLSVCLSVSQSVSQSVCLSVSQSVCLFADFYHKGGSNKALFNPAFSHYFWFIIPPHLKCLFQSPLARAADLHERLCYHQSLFILYPTSEIFAIPHPASRIPPQFHSFHISHQTLVGPSTDPSFAHLLEHYKCCRCKELCCPSNYSCGTTQRKIKLTQGLTANFSLLEDS